MAIKDNIATDVAFGQLGSIHVAGTTAVTSNGVTGNTDKVFCAITFLEDTVFNSSDAGLVAESTQLFPSSAGSGTDIDADGGAVVDSETFPKGITIYGRWTGFTLASGKVIAYLGK
tara:strand:+ start:1290 stop:1637 length:348 start_codon:yes stop_codon:yes gene_type:complete